MCGTCQEPRGGDGTRAHTRGGRAASISAREGAVAEDEAVSASRHTPAVQTRLPHTLSRAPEQHTFLFAVEFSSIGAGRGFVLNSGGSRTGVVRCEEASTRHVMVGVQVPREREDL